MRPATGRGNRVGPGSDATVQITSSGADDIRDDNYAVQVTSSPNPYRK
jgi:hypothetical protein